MDSFFQELIRAAAGGRVTGVEPMSQHTTFHIGGPADYYAAPAGEAPFRECVRLCRREGVPFYVIGNGSNLLVSDAGYRGVILHAGANLSEMEIREEGGEIILRAGAGVPLAAAARAAVRQSLTGLEFAAGIPGTLGGAVVMNAGAYGGEMKQVVRSAGVFTREGEMRNLTEAELDLGYRHSSIPSMDAIVLSAELRLREGDREEIEAVSAELAQRRRDKQPLDFPSAGSTFKRPEGYFAGKLIDDAGLRGFSIGGAQVSPKHCGFVINKGGATAADVISLIREVQRRVEEATGVRLEPEVKLLGFDTDIL